ncbi:MAG: lactoylglutathione lyase [Gammaproteobacteria bacterium]|nr:lactoylglutathione lyase [Gammaproteobacteria bacterium]
MRLLHTMIRVTDMDRSIGFYTQSLGMDLIRKEDFPDGRFSLAFLGYGSETETAVIELTHNWDTDSYTLGDAYGHVAIQCDDLSATCDRIKASAGPGELVSEPHKMKGGPTLAFARDPDGYMIELLGPRCFEEIS